MSEIFKQRLLHSLLFICIGLFVTTLAFFLWNWDTFIPQLATMLAEGNKIDPEGIIIHNTVSIGVLALLLIIISPWFLGLWKKQRHEMYLFFICLYLFSFIFEIARIWIAWITVYPIAKSYAFTLSRVVYFGRITGVTCLFVSSTFAIRQPEKNIGGLLIILLLVSLTLAYIMPIDTSRITNDFLFSVGENVSIDTVLSITILVACINYVILAIQVNYREYSIAMVLFIAFIISKQASNYLYTPSALYSTLGITFLTGMLSVLFQIVVLHKTGGIKTSKVNKNIIPRI